MAETSSLSHLTGGIIYFRAKSEVLLPANIKNAGEQV